MRALIGGLGPDWQPHEKDLPGTPLGAVRVRVVAAALNRADLYMLEGTYNLGGRTGGGYGAGMEFAGVVETSSPMAPHLPVGTRVMGVTVGAFADYAICHPGTLIRIPDNLTFTEAAALPVGLATEHDALTQAGFTAGGRTSPRPSSPPPAAGASTSPSTTLVANGSRRSRPRPGCRARSSTSAASRAPPPAWTSTSSPTGDSGSSAPRSAFARPTSWPPSAPRSNPR